MARQGVRARESGGGGGGGGAAASQSGHSGVEWLACAGGEGEWELEDFQLALEGSGRQRSWQGSTGADGMRFPRRTLGNDGARWAPACTWTSALLTCIPPFSRAPNPPSSERKGDGCGNGAPGASRRLLPPAEHGIWGANAPMGPTPQPRSRRLHSRPRALRPAR